MPRRPAVFVLLHFNKGIGHLSRCAALARALQDHFDVTVFSFGRPLPLDTMPGGVDLVQLLPTCWNLTDFRIRPLDPTHAIEDLESTNLETLWSAWRQRRPAAVVTEYFPLNRWRFGSVLDRFVGMLDREPSAPLLISSLRTCPQEVDMNALEGVNRRLLTRYACVLHHADPAFFPLHALTEDVRTVLGHVPVTQTGFLCRESAPAHEEQPGAGLLLTVGGGGSEFAPDLLRLWLRAARVGPPELHPLKVVCGPLMGAEARAAVRAEAAPDVAVYDWVADLAPLIRASRAVVCMGGYNTMLEALVRGKPVLAFPQHAGRQSSEQSLQVEVLAAKGVILAGDPASTPLEVAGLMAQLLTHRPSAVPDCDGARTSAAIVRRLVEAHTGTQRVAPACHAS